MTQYTEHAHYLDTKHIRDLHGWYEAKAAWQAHQDALRRGGDPRDTDEYPWLDQILKRHSFTGAAWFPRRDQDTEPAAEYQSTEAPGRGWEVANYLLQRLGGRKNGKTTAKADLAARHAAEQAALQDKHDAELAKLAEANDTTVQDERRARIQALTEQIQAQQAAEALRQLEGGTPALPLGAGPDKGDAPWIAWLQKVRKACGDTPAGTQQESLTHTEWAGLTDEERAALRHANNLATQAGAEHVQTWHHGMTNAQRANAIEQDRYALRRAASLAAQHGATHLRTQDGRTVRVDQVPEFDANDTPKLTGPAVGAFFDNLHQQARIRARKAQLLRRRNGGRP